MIFYLGYNKLHSDLKEWDRGDLCFHMLDIKEICKHSPSASQMYLQISGSYSFILKFCFEIIANIFWTLILSRALFKCFLGSISFIPDNHCMRLFFSRWDIWVVRRLSNLHKPEFCSISQSETFLPWKMSHKIISCGGITGLSF